jgi:Mn-containing catalase
MIARDTMHQNQWEAAIEELKADGLESTPVPSSFPLDLEKREHAYQFWNHSEGTKALKDAGQKVLPQMAKDNSSMWQIPNPSDPNPHHRNLIHDSTAHRKLNKCRERVKVM